MNPTLYFSICSLFYCVLLLVNLFKSKRKKTAEGKLLTVLAIINFITLSSETVGIFLGGNYEKYKLINDIILRMMNIFYIWFFSIFIIFIINISKQSKEISFKTHKYIYVIMIVSSIINLFLPISYNFNEAGVIMYSSGISVKMIYYYVMICEGICLAIMFKNYKKTNIHNYSSLFVLVILTALAGMVQSYNPSLLLSASTNTFVLLYAYLNILRRKFLDKGENNDEHK